MSTIRICNVEGCGRKHHAHGYCQRHYNTTPEARAALARYLATDKNRAARARQNARPERREQRRMAEALVRARRAGATIGWAPDDSFAAITLVYGKTCLTPGCDNPATDIDHVVAMKREGDDNRGAHDIRNFQPLCGPCNVAKWTTDTDHRPETSRLFMAVFAKFMTAP